MSKASGRVANGADPDLRSVASDLGLHRLRRPDCTNTSKPGSIAQSRIASDYRSRVASSNPSSAI